MLPEEHLQLREAVRALAGKDIEPYAAQVDGESRFPAEAQPALAASGFNAPHIPDAYGGEGADAVATCIVIEEIARVCASSSLITAVAKLGTKGLILDGDEDLRKGTADIACGALASYALSEREAGSDAAAMRTRARLDGDH